MPVKLNIGAGSTRIDGWIPLDRKLGHEAYPLPKTIDVDGEALELTACSVDEIRASHVLEHFSFADAANAVRDWVRVLKPGGTIKIAVPDVDKVLSNKDDPKRLFYLMGGQTDSDDIHRSAFDEPRLREYMAAAGLVDIKPWQSHNTDCASLPISLNLEGRKPEQAQALSMPVETREMIIKIGAYMTLPRYAAVAPRSIIEIALKPLQIGLTTSQGVFWGQCMQRMFEDALAKELDWILAIDSDSLFTAEQLTRLLDQFGSLPEADALAALQCRRGKGFPLLTVGHQQEVLTDGSPIKVTTAHFGLTLLRIEALREIAKPWFFGKPDEQGEWGDNRLDDDIWFWHQWRLAGKTIYVAPKISIGHLDEMVAVFDDQLKPNYISVAQWREQHL